MNERVYDYSKLCGCIRSRNETHATVAGHANMGPDTFSGKINNKTEFRQKEILEICEFLKIPLNEIPEYFFCEKTLENQSSDHSA